MRKSKKDIDKKLMFDKLIPSGQSRSVQIPNNVQALADEERRNGQQQDIPRLRPQKIRARDIHIEDHEFERDNNYRDQRRDYPQRPPLNREPVYQEEEYEDEEYYEEPKPQPRAVMPERRKAVSPAPAASRRKSDYQIDDLFQQIEKQQKVNKNVLHNINEEIVAMKLESAMEKFCCCDCEMCKQDVTIMALNNITPDYCYIDVDDAEKIAAQKDSSEATKALMKAILHVKNHARHD